MKAFNSPKWFRHLIFQFVFKHFKLLALTQPRIMRKTMKGITLKFLSMIIIIGFAMVNIASAQPVTGIGTGTLVPRWNGTGSVLWDSQITDNGTIVSISYGWLEVSNLLKGYRINSDAVLWHNGITSNLYVGVGAGNFSTSSANINNTFIGYQTGNAINQGHCNVVLGSMGPTIPVGGSTASNALTDGNWNVFIGYEAGHATVDSGNSFKKIMEELF